MDKLSLIRLCIKNDLAAIEELTQHVKELRVQEEIAIFEQQVEEELGEDFSL